MKTYLTLMPARSDTLLADLPRPPRERVRIAWQRLGERDFLTVRLWRHSKNGWRPCPRRGFAFRPDEMAALAEAVAAATAAHTRP